MFPENHPLYENSNLYLTTETEIVPANIDISRDSLLWYSILSLQIWTQWGTLGGKKHPQHSIRCGITNHHVLLLVKKSDKVRSRKK